MVGLFDFVLRGLRLDAQGIVQLGFCDHGVSGAIKFLTEKRFARKGSVAG